MKRKTSSKYILDPTFFSHLAIYIMLSFFILFLFIFSAIGFAYIANIDITGLLPQDVCDGTSNLFNSFYCFLSSAEDNTFYYLIYNFFIIMMILMFLSFIILNVFYISNKFYFKFLVKEKSCGAVIYRIKNNKIEFLLLKMGYGHTSLCKGHQEENETDEETAIREIKEETSLDVKLNTDFIKTIRYKPNESSIKDVIFFLAQPADENQVPIDTHDLEVDAFEWCEYSDALFKITYEQDRDVIKKARRYIKKHRFLE